jgi:hypothetical protein
MAWTTGITCPTPGVRVTSARALKVIPVVEVAPTTLSSDEPPTCWVRRFKEYEVLDSTRITERASELPAATATTAMIVRS